MTVGEPGLNIAVAAKPNTTKAWRLRIHTYTPEGQRKEAELTLGVHPDLSRDDAATAAVRIKQRIKDGLTPQAALAEFRGETPRRTAPPAASDTLRHWTLRYLLNRREAGHGRNGGRMSYSNRRTTRRALKQHILDYEVGGQTLGARPITEIEAHHLEASIKRVLRPNAKGDVRKDLARRLVQHLNHIFNEASVRTRGEVSNPMEWLLRSEQFTRSYRRSKVEKQTNQHRHLPIELMPAYYQAVAKVGLSELERHLLHLLPMLMLRASNLVSMRWEWVKPGNTVWRYGYLDIPASEMKSRRDFQLPLTKQVKDRLDAIRALGLSDTFVFPNPHCRSGHYRHEWMTKAFEDLKLKDGRSVAPI